MSSISQYNVNYFVRDYLSTKEGESDVNTRGKIVSLLNMLNDISSELEDKGYSLDVVVRPRMYYTEEDKEQAREEDIEVRKDIVEYLKELS